MNSFTKTLTNWYRGHKRDLPWRATKDPYPVWLSEIILQQTRVEQGLPYWEHFLTTFPTIESLAIAKEEQVLRLWQGLGYYSRARNLHETAKYIHEHLEDKFPSSYEGLLKLKGVGPYTAAAISSICFDEKKPVVDGNVFRFTARFFGVDIDTGTSGARKKFEEMLLEHIPIEKPGDFNQAMMEFGAKVCAPSPNCSDCVFQNGCYAFKNALQKTLPIKKKKIKVRDRHINYVVLIHKEEVYMKLRTSNDIWKGLYDFPEVEGKIDEEEVLSNVASFLNKGDFVLNEVSEEKVHLLSHQKIFARFYELELDKALAKSVVQKKEITAFSIEEILNLPKPKLIVNHLEERGII